MQTPVTASSPPAARPEPGVGLAGSAITSLAYRAPLSETLTYRASLTYTTWLPLVFNNRQRDDLPYGIHVFHADEPAQEKIVGMQSRWVRIPFHWGAVEPENTTPDHYQWPAALDQQLIDLAAQNIQVILLFGGNPRWAATYYYGPIDRTDLSEVTEFMQAAAARYRQPPFNIRHWEMYNEEDCGDPLYADYGAAYFGHFPQEYVDILAAVYQPVKAVAPDVQILMGGIAYDLWEPDGAFVHDFLDQVLQRGGANYFDMMNFHYYVAFDSVWAPYGHGILGKLAFLRDKLADYGVEKPFLCSESGWFSDEPGGSAEVQARYAVQLYARVLSVDMKPVIWFQLVDDSMPGPPKWGLLNPDMSPKPAYFAYQTTTSQLTHARYVRELSDAATGSSAIEAYEFALTAEDMATVVAWTNDWITHSLTITSPLVTRVDKLGTSDIVYDWHDGMVDGRVILEIGPSPVFLRYNPGFWPGPQAGLGATTALLAPVGRESACPW